MSEIPPKDSTSPREIPLKVETRLDLAHGLDLEHVDASGAFLQAQSTHEDRNRDVSVTYGPAAVSMDAVFGVDPTVVSPGVN